MFQIRRGKRDNLWIFSVLLLLNICCDPLLEHFHRDGSNEGSQHVFIEKLENLSLNYPQSGALKLMKHFLCKKKKKNPKMTIKNYLNLSSANAI